MRNFLPILFIFIFISGESQMPIEQSSDSLFLHTLTSKNNLLEEGHLFNKSRGTSVGIKLSHLGFGPVIAPPCFCYPFAVNLVIFGNKVPVMNYQWILPETIYQGETIKGIGSQLKVTPVAKERGVIAEVEITNTNDYDVSVPIDWFIEGQVGSSTKWEWYPPAAMFSKKEDTKISADGAMLTFTNGQVSVLIKCTGIEMTAGNNKLGTNIKICSNEKRSFNLILLIGMNTEILHNVMNHISADPSETRRNAHKDWENLLMEYESKVPLLKNASEELSNFYKKSLITFHTCRWEVSEFAINPWFAESGLDGGALNNYCWGLAYISRFMSILEPEAVRELLLAYVQADLAQAYAINPSNREGMGVLYSYNYYSIARATFDYVTTTGDTSILSEKINNETYLEYIYRFCLLHENLEKDPVLIDYGENHNLLELKRTNNFTCYTPSPNAERLLIYQYLTRLYKWMNVPIPHDLTTRGIKLKETFREELWDSQNNWVYSMDKNGQKMTAYSIQVFDLLRTGILTKVQEKAIVKHLKDKEFLSAWGVHSMALTDPGYDTNDVDWGGPGIYAGDAPELVEDLINAGFTNEGVNLLQRIQWWGELPYFPQAIRADIQGYRKDGRPNVIAGLAASQCIIFGLFGITANETYISIKPVKHPVMQGVSLKGLQLRGININISIADDGDSFRVQYGSKNETQQCGDEVIIEIEPQLFNATALSSDKRD